MPQTKVLRTMHYAVPACCNCFCCYSGNDLTGGEHACTATFMMGQCRIQDDTFIKGRCRKNGVSRQTKIPVKGASTSGDALPLTARAVLSVSARCSMTPFSRCDFLSSAVNAAICLLASSSFACRTSVTCCEACRTKDVRESRDKAGEHLWGTRAAES